MIEDSRDGVLANVVRRNFFPTSNSGGAPRVMV